MSVAYLWVFVMSFSQMPLIDAKAISYTQGIYLVLFAALILNDRVSPRSWMATGAGFVGAMLVVGPSFNTFTPIYLVALLGASLNALALVLTKILERDDTALTVMLYVNAIGLMANVPVLPSYDVIDLGLWPWLLALLILGPVGVLCGILAVQTAPISTLAPYMYTRLILAVAFGYMFLGEVPTCASLVGTALILSS